MLVGIMVGLAAVAGAFLPLRWGVAGFLAAAAGVYGIFFAVLASRGFEGLPLEESLLLFEGSMAAYLGFNALVAYRAMALPLLLLGAVVVFRQSRVR